MSEKFPSVLGTEERILLGCARLDMDERTRVILDDLLRQQVDWETLFKRSIEQSMTPLLYKHLQAEPQWWHLVPVTMRLQLERVYRRNMQRNRLLLSELDQLLAALSAAEVRVILMKELHLLQTVYPEPGLRPIGDLDLLVPQKDFERAKGLLGEAGYHPLLAANPFKDKYGFGYHFINESKGIWIDLQWNLSQREWAQDERRDDEFRAPIEDVWSRARPGRLQNSRAWRMSWEDLLFHLCVHSEGHGFNEIIQFCDIAEVVRLYRENLNWQAFVDIVRHARMEGSVYCAFSFIRQVLGVSLPNGLLERLHPDHLKFDLYHACFAPLGRLHTFLDESANDPSVPAEAMRQWEEAVRNTATRNLHAYASLDAITEELASEGFHPIALKTRRAEQWLPHPNLEPMGNVEILVADEIRAEKYPHTVEEKFFIAETARTANRHERLAEAAGASLHESTCARAVVSRRYGALQHCSARELLKRVQQSRQKQQALPVPIHLVAPEEALLVLCLRFSRSTAPWLALCMAAEFLRNVSRCVSWQKFWDKAKQLRETKAAAIALLSVLELTSVEIPQAALQAIENLGHELRFDLFPSTASPHAASPVLKQALQKIYRFCLLPTFKDRRNYLANFIKISYWKQGIWAKFRKPVADAFRFSWLLLRDKIRRHRRAPATVHAYWLEQPQAGDAEAAAPGCRRSAVTPSEMRWRELAIA